jgi:hypothetical protein
MFTSSVRGDKILHTVSQSDSTGKEIFSETEEIAFAVGSGEHGLSFVILRGGQFFMSPISYYTSQHRWDLTPGYAAGLYRDFTRGATELCIDCHSGLPQRALEFPHRYLNPPFRILAIGCERCHGPGQNHVERRTAGLDDSANGKATIVNPKKLPPRLRDDVCYQCHYSGDARVLRPGKRNSDFRPGTLLDDVVSIFSVPAARKGASFEALGHVEQLKLSQCRTADREELSCITCHDPHVQPGGVNAVNWFRDKCLSCHTKEICQMPLPRRQSTTPPDNCLACHMPKRSLGNVAHTALTDHRIPRGSASESIDSVPPFPEPEPDLYWHNRPVDAKDPDLRSLALAYAELAHHSPYYEKRAFPILQRAAEASPEDTEIQGAYGLFLTTAHPSQEELRLARQALERAIASGSKSIQVRIALGNLLLKTGNQDALRLLEEALGIDPFSSSAGLALARAYYQTGDSRKAISTLNQILSSDPGNPDARKIAQELGSSH